MSGLHPSLWHPWNFLSDKIEKVSFVMLMKWPSGSLAQGWRLVARGTNQWSEGWNFHPLSPSTPDPWGEELMTEINNQWPGRTGFELLPAWWTRMCSCASVQGPKLLWDRNSCSWDLVLCSFSSGYWFLSFTKDYNILCNKLVIKWISWFPESCEPL